MLANRKIRKYLRRLCFYWLLAWLGGLLGGFIVLTTGVSNPNPNPSLFLFFLCSYILLSLPDLHWPKLPKRKVKTIRIAV